MAVFTTDVNYRILGGYIILQKNPLHLISWTCMNRGLSVGSRMHEGSLAKAGPLQLCTNTTANGGLGRTALSAQSESKCRPILPTCLSPSLHCSVLRTLKGSGQGCDCVRDGPEFVRCQWQLRRAGTEEAAVSTLFRLIIPSKRWVSIMRLSGTAWEWSWLYTRARVCRPDCDRTDTTAEATACHTAEYVSKSTKSEQRTVSLFSHMSGFRDLGMGMSTRSREMNASGQQNPQPYDTCLLLLLKEDALLWKISWDVKNNSGLEMLPKIWKHTTIWMILVYLCNCYSYFGYDCKHSRSQCSLVFH